MCAGLHSRHRPWWAQGEISAGVEWMGGWNVVEREQPDPEGDAWRPLLVSVICVAVFSIGKGVSPIENMKEAPGCRVWLPHD